jgi:MFS family permease
MDRLAVATHLQHAAVAMVAGFALFGMIADAAHRIGLPPTMVQIIGVAIAILTQAAMALDMGIPPLVGWTLYSFFASASVMGYSLLSQRFPAELAGRVNTAVNLLMFIVAFTLQPAIGWALGHFPAASGGYTVEGHRLAMLAVVATQAVCVFAPLALARRHEAPTP